MKKERGEEGFKVQGSGQSLFETTGKEWSVEVVLENIAANFMPPGNMHKRICFH